MLPLETMSFQFWIEVMTPRLISSHHSSQELIPFPGIALQMINTVGHATCFLLWLKTMGYRLGAHFVPVQSFRHDGVNASSAQSNLGGYGFHCNSTVLGNESINQLDDVIGNEVWCSRLATLANNTCPSLKRLCHALTLARDMQCSLYTCDILK